ncbi:MAG: response regulator transcription factor [Petrimonas sp.]|jgi:DNA-binding NarL/FixJ family response regulator|nr:response regulator transcription factor [Petrimonas sp.]
MNTEEKKIKLLIVDDHQIVRDGIVALLQNDPQLTIVGEAHNGKMAVELAGELHPDVVIMDVIMPVMDGIASTRLIREKYPEIKLLALTMTDELEHIKNMIDAGAGGYLLKNSGKEELIAAIKEVLAGREYFSGEVKDAIVHEMIKKKTTNVRLAGEPIPLTRREKDVLLLIVREFTNSEIAEKLFISVRTVDAHRRNLLEKTGARNTAGLVKYAIENHLTE